MKDAAMQSPRSWLAAQVEMWQVADLVPYAKNARQHPPEQIDQIAASMERFGFTIPMLVAEDGTIIAGHGRLMAAAQLGLATISASKNSCCEEQLHWVLLRSERVWRRMLTSYLTMCRDASSAVLVR